MPWCTRDLRPGPNECRRFATGCRGKEELLRAGLTTCFGSVAVSARWARRPPDSRRDGGATALANRLGARCSGVWRLRRHISCEPRQVRQGALGADAGRYSDSRRSRDRHHRASCRNDIPMPVRSIRTSPRRRVRPPERPCRMPPGTMVASSQRRVRYGRDEARASRRKPPHVQLLARRSGRLNEGVQLFDGEIFLARPRRGHGEIGAHYWSIDRVL